MSKIAIRWGGVLALVLVGLSVPTAGAAKAGRVRVEEGNRLYQDGRFAEAHQKYLEAMAEAQGHRFQSPAGTPPSPAGSRRPGRARFHR